MTAGENGNLGLQLAARPPHSSTRSCQAHATVGHGGLPCNCVQLPIAQSTIDGALGLNAAPCLRQASSVRRTLRGEPSRWSRLMISAAVPLRPFHSAGSGEPKLWYRTLIATRSSAFETRRRLVFSCTATLVVARRTRSGCGLVLGGRLLRRAARAALRS